MRKLVPLVLLLATVASAEELLVVANRGGTTVTLIDPATMENLGQIDAGIEPHEVAVSADGRLAYVTNYEGSFGASLSVIDLVARAKVKTIPIGSLRGPHGIAERNGRIYFTAERSAAVARYDPLTDRIDWIGRTTAFGGHMLAVNRDATRVYTSHIPSGTAAIIPVSGVESTASKIVPVVSRPEGIALRPDERELWVGSLDSGISIIDLATESVVATIAQNGSAYRIFFTPDGRLALIPRGRNLVVIDATTREQVRVVAMPGQPFSLAVNAEGTIAYVAMGNPDQVAKLDLIAWEVLASVAAPPVPDGIAIARAQPVAPQTPPPRRRSVRSP